MSRKDYETGKSCINYILYLSIIIVIATVIVALLISCSSGQEINKYNILNTLEEKNSIEYHTIYYN